LWFAFATLGVFTVQAASESLGLYAGTALLGLALGAEIELAAYYVTRYFGLLRFGAIYGFMISIYSIASALGPLLMGMAHDLTGTYALAGLVLGGCAGFCTLLMLPAYRFALPGGKD
jgi:cyanate permease